MADCIYRRSVKSLAAAFLLLGVCALAASDEPTKITGVRFWTLGDLTRVAIEADSEFAFKALRLTNPDRLFFDIADARPDAKGTQSIPVDDGIVKRIRIAQTQKGVTRVVLDLEQAAEYKTSLLRGPARLIVELRSKDAPPASKIPEERTFEPKTEQVEEANVFVGPKVVTHPQMPRRFSPPPMELLPTPPRKSAPLPSIAYVTPPPAFALFAKPSKLPSASLPSLPRPVVSSRIEESSRLEPLPTGKSPIPARKNGDGAQTMTRVLGLKLGRVVIDPGHGGFDDGTHGASGIKEKDLVLDISLRLGSLIEQRLGSEVVFTRADDTYIPLDERTHIANEKRADLFLSIHANSSPDHSVSGIETYYLSMNGAKAGMDTATRENAGSPHSIFDLKELLNKIALKDKIDESREFASSVQNSLYSLAQKSNKSARDRGTRRAPFVVLIGAEMPSVLAEIGFLTNSSEESLLRRDEYRDKVSEALYKGIAAYAETLSRTVVAEETKVSKTRVATTKVATTKVATTKVARNK